MKPGDFIQMVIDRAEAAFDRGDVDWLVAYETLPAVFAPSLDQITLKVYEGKRRAAYSWAWLPITRVSQDVWPRMIDDGLRSLQKALVTQMRKEAP